MYNTVEDEKIRDLVQQILLYSGSIENIDFDKLMEPDPTKEIEQPSLSFNFRDYRLLDIRLLNVRIFPFDKEIPYGIDFTNNKYEACSAFIVGNNGFGKSSIYSALEYLYTGHCSYAQRINKSPTDYLTNIFKDKMPEPHQNMNIVGTNPDQYIQSADKKPIGIPAAFTSDYDIEELEHSDDNLYSYVVRGIGYEDVLVLQNKLKDKISEKQENWAWLRNYIDSENAELDIKDYQHIKRELARLSTIDNTEEVRRLMRFVNSEEVDIAISNLEKEVQQPFEIEKELFSEVWEILESNIQLYSSKDAKKPLGPIQKDVNEDVIKDEISLGIRRIKMLYKKLLEYYLMLELPVAHKDIKFFLKIFDVAEKLDKEYEGKDKQRDITEPRKNAERLKQEIDVLSALENNINKTLSDILKEYYNAFRSFIEETMTTFSFHGGYDETFRIVIDDNSLKLKLELKNSNGETPQTEISPRAYFNTFRFKLYALTLRLTLAFAYMKENNILIPIVIDDVFNASDFENGLKIEQFVYNIYKTYREQLNFQQPLQLIILTHDEMILNSFRRGIKLKYAEDIKCFNKGLQPEDYFVCGRLYPYWKHQDLKKLSTKKLGFHNIFFHYSINK